MAKTKEVKQAKEIKEESFEVKDGTITKIDKAADEFANQSMILPSAEIMERREMWYNRIDVIFEIIKSLQAREAALLGKANPVRCIKAHNIEYLKSNLRAFHFFERPYNLYISLAKLRNMPCFCYKPDERKRQQQVFNDEFNRYLYGYDWGNDFDNKGNFNKLKKQVLVFADLLREYKVTHCIKSSGNGFHITVPWEVIAPFYDLPRDSEDLIHDLEDMGMRINDIYNLPWMDTGVYQLRRVWKCPYSFDIKSGNIALPISYEELKKAKEGFNSCENAAKLDIKTRGLMVWQGEPEGFKKLRDYLLS